MASVKFYPDKERKGQSLILLSFTFNHIRIKLTTGLHVPPKAWDTKAQKAKPFNEYPEINKRLREIKTFLFDQYDNLFPKGIKPAPEEVKERSEKIKDSFMVFTGRKQVVSPDQPTLLTFISTFQERMRENRSSRYLTHFTPLRHHLEEYGKTIGHEVDFKHINMDFYHDFLRYLTAKGLKKNTIGSIIKRLKRIMSVALKEEMTTNRRFQDNEFKALTEEVDTIYLKEDEIQALYEMELKHERAEIIRDLFVLNCYTGLRHSDWDKITEQAIKDGNIHLRTQKTNEKVVIPVNAIATAIIEKYKTKGLKVPSLQEVNRVLKWIGEKAEMDHALDPEKCRQLTSHCARRSFASNAYLAVYLQSAS